MTKRRRPRAKAPFKSRFEQGIAENLTHRGALWGYETIKLSYSVPDKTYTPDFIVTSRSGKQIIVEAKGYFKYTDRAKMLLVRDQHIDLDIRLLFARASNKIAPSSNTSYGEWATANGFIWAEGSIPDAWLEE